MKLVYIEKYDICYERIRDKIILWKCKSSKSNPIE